MPKGESKGWKSGVLSVSAAAGLYSAIGIPVSFLEALEPISGRYFRHQRECLRSIREDSALVRAKVVQITVEWNVVTLHVDAKHFDWSFFFFFFFFFLEKGRAA